MRLRPGERRHALVWARGVSAVMMLAALLAFIAGLAVSPQGLSGQAAAVPAQAALGSADSQPSVVRQADTERHLAGTIALKLAPGARLVDKLDGTLVVAPDWDAASCALDHLADFPLRESDQLPQLGVHLLEPTQPECAVEDLVSALQVTPGVVWAEASYTLEACGIPNDPYYSPGPLTSVGEWGFTRTGFPAAWDMTTGSEGVVVAVLDTGLNRDVQDFAGRIVFPYSVISDSSTWPAWQDNQGHGTQVASVAVAEGNNGLGIAGAAWDVGIMPVKISETGTSNTSFLAEAIIYAVDHGADVLNISFAGSGTTRTLTDAVEYALARGATIVAAAGNDGAFQVSYPAALPGVIAVGATDPYDSRWSDTDGASNMGAALDVMAPGKAILTYAGTSATSLTYRKGTSLATPFVSGLAALMLSVWPSLTPEEVVDILAATAEDLGSPGWDQEFGWGLIDAAEAVGLAAAGGSTTTSSTSSTTTTTTERPFSDVSESTPYWREIEHLAALGVVSGDGYGLFHPNDPVKRQQFTKIIVLALAYPVSTADRCLFVDVEQSEGEELYPDHYIAVAHAHGIVQGIDAVRMYFSPYGSVTRAQMITMVVRAAGLTDPPPDYQPDFFPEQFPSQEHYLNARKAAYAGLLGGLVGVGPDYDFAAPATRGEVCALVYTLIK